MGMDRFAIMLSVTFMIFGCATSPPDVMSQQSIFDHIEKIAGVASVSANVVEIQYKGIAIACVSDEVHDRICLIAPIARLNAAEAARLEILLIANFQSTLDVRYAINEGVICAAFMHPLSTLTRPQLESTIHQVASLSSNFGSIDSSGELTCGANPGAKSRNEFRPRKTSLTRINLNNRGG